MTVKTQAGLALLLAAITLVSSHSTFAQAQFTACDEDSKQANGLCTAALAIGCDQDGTGGACIALAERYERITGMPGPWVDMTPPDISCASPYDGEIVDQSPGSAVSFSGRVEDVSSLSELFVNGTPVQPDASGEFSAELTGEWGANFVELTATDGAGNTSDRTCTYLLSDVWAPAGVTLNDTVSVKAHKPVVDDSNRADALDSFADILQTIVNSPGLKNDLHAELSGANPLKDSCDAVDPFFGVCVMRTEIRYIESLVPGINTVSLALISGGLHADSVLPKVRLKLRVSGQLAGIPYDSTGWVDFEKVRVIQSYDVFLSGDPGLATVRVRSVSTSIDSIKTDFSGLDGLILDILGIFINATLRGSVEGIVEDFVHSEFGDILNDAFAGLDVHNLPAVFDVSQLDDVSALGIRFTTQNTSLNVSASRMLSGIGTRIESTPAHSRPTMGAPVPPGNRRLDVATVRALGVAVHDGAINQVLHALWQGGYFDVSLTGGALGGLIPPDVSVDTTAMLPAAARLREDGRLELAIGALLVRLTYPELLTQAADASVAARGSCAPTLLGDDLSLADCRVEELHLSLGAHKLDAVTVASMESFVQGTINEVFRLTLNDMLPALPLPGYILPQALTAYGLPGGSEMGLKAPTLTIVGEHGVVDGEFGLVP